jgi:hypothetical protein
MRPTEFDELILAEGWEIQQEGDETYVLAMGEKIKYAHPFSIWAKICRTTGNPRVKFTCLRAMHKLAWPAYELTWNAWDERRLKIASEDWNYISYAGGGSTGKSDFAARFALLYFLENPRARTVLVASTTLQALSTRIWGYISRFANQMAIDYPFTVFSGNSPKILYDKKDPIHGMYALAAGKGTDEKAISNWIGRHPKEAMLVILDEATDLDPALLKSLPNLQSGDIEFKCMVIGNSCSRFDLHGCLSTPACGWKKLDPMKEVSWLTTQKNGICLYFNPYESPAIHEPDLERRKRLGKFLITRERIEEKKKDYGEESDGYWRFVLGLWKADSEDETVVSRKFIDSFNVQGAVEWSGLHQLNIVAGLDPAYSQGGDSCILRLGVLGQSSNGQVMLDFRKEQLLYKIKINPLDARSAELQIADKVLEILNTYACPLSNLCVDSNGQGRALAEVIRLRAKSLEMPLKIYSVRSGNTVQKSFDVIIKTNYELWYEFRRYIQSDQIRGLDYESLVQLTSRLVETKNGKQYLEPKPTYKARMGTINPSQAHSPDEADAAALALQVAILKFGFTPGQRREVKREETFTAQKMYAAMSAKLVEEEHSREVRLVDDFSCDIYSASKVKMPFS